MKYRVICNMPFVRNLRVSAAAGIVFGLSLSARAAPALVLVENGVSLAPIVIFADAPRFTRNAAEELADYIEKTSGARPEVLEGEPDPLPERAIWVGFQPVLAELFPEVNFDFQHPEEILITANETHLVIAGRDRWHPDRLTGRTWGREGRITQGVQGEYGTANAVYTFLQDHLDVRWLWPGELGEDVITRDTLAFAPFTYRYHPQFRGRSGVFFIYMLHRKLAGHQWARYQRLQLDSLLFDAGHLFSDWWGRFHETHPDFFALQPDGSRGGGKRPYPDARMVKLCKSNPAVWDQWLKDVEAQLEDNPNLQVFGANPNDGYGAGYCICANCLAWDHQEGASLRVSWQGLSQEYVAMSDRQITFANQLARKLKERFPDRNDLYVSAMAYGSSRSTPVEARPDDNVIVIGVFNFMSRPIASHQALFHAWSDLAQNYIWRPNLGGAAGFGTGLTRIHPNRVIEEMRMAADHGVIGLFLDSILCHWGTQGPHNYMLAHMAWNPYADGQAILADYYRRAFGPAADDMTAYWTQMEAASEAIIYQDQSADDVWDGPFYARGYAHLDRAAKAVSDAPTIYGKRVAFVRAGFDYMRLIRETEVLIERLRAGGGQDAEAEAAARANWAEIERIIDNHPYVVNQIYVGPGRSVTRSIHPDHYR